MSGIRNCSTFRANRAKLKRAPRLWHLSSLQSSCAFIRKIRNSSRDLGSPSQRPPQFRQRRGEAILAWRSPVGRVQSDGPSAQSQGNIYATSNAFRIAKSKLDYGVQDYCFCMSKTQFRRGGDLVPKNAGVTPISAAMQQLCQDK